MIYKNFYFGLISFFFTNQIDLFVSFLIITVLILVLLLDIFDLRKKVIAKKSKEETKNIK